MLFAPLKELLDILAVRPYRVVAWLPVGDVQLDILHVAFNVRIRRDEFRGKRVSCPAIKHKNVAALAIIVHESHVLSNILQLS